MWKQDFYCCSWLSLRGLFSPWIYRPFGLETFWKQRLFTTNTFKSFKEKSSKYSHLSRRNREDDFWKWQFYKKFPINQLIDCLFQLIITSSSCEQTNLTMKSNQIGQINSIWAFHFYINVWNISCWLKVSVFNLLQCQIGDDALSSEQLQRKVWRSPSSRLIHSDKVRRSLWELKDHIGDALISGTKLFHWLEKNLTAHVDAMSVSECWRPELDTAVWIFYEVSGFRRSLRGNCSRTPASILKNSWLILRSVAIKRADKCERKH